MILNFNQFQHHHNSIIPETDITLDMIGVCPIDDHATFGCQFNTAIPIPEVASPIHHTPIPDLSLAYGKFICDIYNIEL